MLHADVAKDRLMLALQCSGASGLGTCLLIQGFVVLKQRLEGLEHFHLAGHSGRGLGLTLHHRHPQRALVTGHQTLQMLQQKLTERERETEKTEGRKPRQRKREERRERRKTDQEGGITNEATRRKHCQTSDY